MSAEPDVFIIQLLIKFYLALFFFGNLAVIVAIWLKGSQDLVLSRNPAFVLIAWGRVFGLFLEYLLLIQIVLMGRITFLEDLFGHDGLNRIHRWLGYSLALFLVLHPLLLSFGYGKAGGIHFIPQFLLFIKNWEDILNAVLGVLVFLAVITTSIFIRKKVRYESWYFVHLLAYVGIFLAFGHQTQTADVASGGAFFYWYALNLVLGGVFLAYRWLRPFWNFYRHGFFVEKIIQETDDIFSVYIGGKNLANFKFRAGQFANLNFVQKNLWFTHPFSFSSAPTGKHLRFTVKALGDFTSKISQIHPNTKVIIDGPLGAFVASGDKNKYLFLAGGVGITPIRALMEDLASKDKDLALIYSAKTKNALAFFNELNAINSKNYFALTGEQAAGFTYGRIDAEKIKTYVPDFIQRDIFICGPKKMISGAISALKTLGVPKNQIHSERFEY